MPKANWQRGSGHPEGVTLKRALALVGWSVVAVAVAVGRWWGWWSLPLPLPLSLPLVVGGVGGRCCCHWSSALWSLLVGAVVFAGRCCGLCWSALWSLLVGAVVFGVQRFGRVLLSFLPLPCGAVVVVVVRCGLRCGALWACAAVLCDISSRGLNVGRRVGGSPLVILLVIYRARWGCDKLFTTFEVSPITQMFITFCYTPSLPPAGLGWVRICFVLYAHCW
jgi:hypothetical protein